VLVPISDEWPTLAVLPLVDVPEPVAALLPDVEPVARFEPVEPDASCEDTRSLDPHDVNAAVTHAARAARP
jgi:hypothetical protein